MNEICELYKRIMKHDAKEIDEINSLEEAKEIIKMMSFNVYYNDFIITMVKRRKEKV